MELKDWLNSINFNKQNLIEEDPSAIKDYPPYIVNRCLSGHLDCVLFANEMNKYSFLDKDMQYSFYLNTLRKKKRFSPWLRKDKVTDLEIIKQYYGQNVLIHDHLYDHIYSSYKSKKQYYFSIP